MTRIAEARQASTSGRSPSPTCPPASRRVRTCAAAPPQGTTTAGLVRLLSPAAEDFAAGQRSVELICTDVDGTLLDARQRLTPGVQRAVQAAAAAGVPLVTITGKAMGPWRQDVHPHLGSSMPQVYLQGLLVTDARGAVLHSRPLAPELIRDAIAFAAEHRLALTAYLGDRIVCERRDEQTDRLIFYKEPTPEAIGPLAPYVGELPIHKIIFMAPEPRICQVRPEAEALYVGRASLTTAIDGMLEVLPLGASKAEGLSFLLERLGVDPANVMSVGDGENDKEMLAYCGLGVAMGNAGPQALAVADAVTLRNDEDGAARAVEEFVLHPRGLHFGHHCAQA